MFISPVCTYSHQLCLLETHPQSMLLEDHLPFIQCFLSSQGSTSVHVVEGPPSIHPVLLVFSRLILSPCCWKTTFHSSSASCLLQAHPQSMLLEDNLPFIQCFLSSPGSSSINVVGRPPSIHPVLLVFSRHILNQCCWKTTFHSSSASCLLQAHPQSMLLKDHLPFIQCFLSSPGSSSVHVVERPPSIHPVLLVFSRLISC